MTTRYFLMNLTFKIAPFLMLSLLIPSVYGQDVASFEENIRVKFRKYCATVPWEEIFIHTDRSDYIAGELLWFNIYLIDRQSNKPSHNSRIAYFELLNSENWPVVQERIKIEEGSGHGQITLPDTLSTGRYTIRSYTSWMKNFMPDNCFMKDVNIYNAFGMMTGIRTSKEAGVKDYIPEIGISTVPGEYGFVMKVDNLVPDTLLISISTDDKFRKDNKNCCHLFIQTHGIINLIKTVKLSSTVSRVELSKDILIPGINQITIFDSGGQPLAERFIYTPSAEYQNLVVCSPDKIKTREHIFLEIKPEKSINSSLDLFNLSVSISEVAENKYVNDISDYMVFGSEFGILPDEIRNCKLSSLSPEFIDNFLSAVRSNWIDWQIILTGNYPHLKYKTEKEVHILSGTLLGINSEAHCYNRCVFLSIPDKTPTFQYARTDSSGSFDFRIPVDDVIRSLIIQPEEADVNTTIRIESSFSEEYRQILNPDDPEILPVPETISEWSANYQIRKIYEIPESGEALKQQVCSSKVRRFYGKPDIELIMADYIKLSTMEEVFFELTPGLIFKNRKSGYSMSIFDPVGKMVLKKPPLLFIDGVVVNDPAVIADLDPGLVEKIDALTDLYLVGDYCFFGLVNIITLTGDFSCVSLPPYAVRVNYKTVNSSPGFLSPDYQSVEKKENRIPDLRNTLYWNPSVKPDKDGVFGIDLWASDNIGLYEINLQGLLQDGQSIAVRRMIRIE